MELVLAMDLRGNMVVHGKSGLRETYKPLDWGLSPTAEPVDFVRAIAPKYIYIADLDRIEGTGSHDALIRSCAALWNAVMSTGVSARQVITLPGRTLKTLSAPRRAGTISRGTMEAT